MWGACRPVTLATFWMSVEARLCQGCAHSAHPQGLALIESGLHAASCAALLNKLERRTDDRSQRPPSGEADKIDLYQIVVVMSITCPPTNSAEEPIFRRAGLPLHSWSSIIESFVARQTQRRKHCIHECTFGTENQMLNSPEQEYANLRSVEGLIDKNDEVVMRQIAISSELILKLIILDIENRLKDCDQKEYENYCSTAKVVCERHNADSTKKMGHYGVLDLWETSNMKTLWRKVYDKEYFPTSFNKANLQEIYRFCNPAKHGRSDKTQKPTPTKLRKMFFSLKELLEEGFPEINFGISDNPAPPSIKHNLPRKPLNFVGRDDDRDRLLQYVHRDNRAYYICISGMGGVGKSTLAVEMGLKCLELGQTDSAYAYDYIVWATAKERHYLENQIKKTQQDKVFNKSHIISEMGRLFFEDAKLMDEEERERQVFSYLRTNPVLLIIDNAEDVKDESLKLFLKNIPQPSKVVTTDRVSDPEATDVALRGLSKDYTIDLINECRKQQMGMHLSEDDFNFIYEFSKGIPLLVEQVMVNLKNGVHLSTISDRLLVPQGSELSKYLFEEEYQKVSQTSKDILNTVAIIDVDAVNGKVLCELVGLTENSFEEATTELVARHNLLLVDNEEIPVIEQSVSILPIFRAYIKTFLTNTNVPKNVINNLCVMLTTTEEDKDWVSLRTINFIDKNIQIFEWAVDDSFSRKEFLIVIQLARYTLYALDIRGHHTVRNFICTLGIKAADIMKRTGDSAYFHIQGLAWDNFQKGNYKAASQNIEKGLEIASDAFTVAIAKRLQGLIHKEQRRYDEAERCLIEAKDAFIKLGKKKLLSITYGSLGSCARELNDLNQSEEYMIKAFEALDGAQNSEELASIFSQKLCKLYISNSMLDKAEEHLNISLEYLQKINRPLGFAYYKHYNALISEGRGDIITAYGLCKEAEKLFQKYGNKLEIKEDMRRIKEKHDSLSEMVAS